MTVIRLLIIILLTISCSETEKPHAILSLKGNRYADVMDGEGIFEIEDSLGELL